MLEILFGSKLRAKLLGWLMIHPEKRYYVRQITSILNEDSTNTSRELSKLAGLGILICQKEGKQKYYQVNSQCPIFNELQGLAIKTTGVGDVLRNALKPVEKQINIAFIFGSFADNRFDGGSDVDAMIVGKITLAEVNKVLHVAQEKLQREINPTVYSLEEFTTEIAKGNHFLKRILTKPKIFLIGDENVLTGLA